jgi:hypothetical protein
MTVKGWITLCVLLVVGAGLWWARDRIPNRWNPWAPLKLVDEPNWVTAFKFRRASQDENLCRSVLAQADWSYTPIPDEVTKPGCGYRSAVRVERMTAKPNEPFAASCREALALALWEYHVVQPAAQRLFGERVTRIEHFGSYSCRGVYGRPNASLSHHATADALDVAGFVIGKDTRIRVLRNWGAQDTKGEFLRDVSRGACNYFDAVLGPEYNRAHRDHLHLDRGEFRICS